MPPQMVHYGRDKQLTLDLAVTLEAAFAAYPQRSKGLSPKPPTVPTAA